MKHFDGYTGAASFDISQKEVTFLLPEISKNSLKIRKRPCPNFQFGIVLMANACRDFARQIEAELILDNAAPLKRCFEKVLHCQASNQSKFGLQTDNYNLSVTSQHE